MRRCASRCQCRQVHRVETLLLRCICELGTKRTFPVPPSGWVQPASPRCRRILATAPVNVTHPNLICRLASAFPIKTSSVTTRPRLTEHGCSVLSGSVRVGDNESLAGRLHH